MDVYLLDGSLIEYKYQVYSSNILYVSFSA